MSDSSSEPSSKRSGTPLWHWAVILTAFLVVLNFASIRESIDGPINYDINTAGAVTLYGTTWCGYCRKVRSVLERHNIPFEDLDIEKNQAANRAFARLGGTGVPVVTVGNRVVHGFNYSRLRKLLECGDCP